MLLLTSLVFGAVFASEDEQGVDDDPLKLQNFITETGDPMFHSNSTDEENCNQDGAPEIHAGATVLPERASPSSPTFCGLF
jgi:hypothetical protein